MTRAASPDGAQVDEPLWKVEDAAAFLRLSLKAVYGLVEAGQLPCVRIGTRIRFVPAVLAAWVEAQAGREPALLGPSGPAVGEAGPSTAGPADGSDAATSRSPGTEKAHG